MMKSTHLRHLYDSTFVRRLNWTDCRAVHLKRQMGTKPILVFDVRRKNAPQMRLAQHDHVVEAFTPDTAVQSLRVTPHLM